MDYTPILPIDLYGSFESMPAEIQDEYRELAMRGIQNDLRHMINDWRKEQGLDIQLRIWAYCPLAPADFYTGCTAIGLPLPMMDTPDVTRFTFEGWEARVLVPDNRYDHINLSEYQLYL